MDAESTVTRDIGSVSCIPALAQATMEKLVENVSLVNMNIAGTPIATPVMSKKTKPTKCNEKVVKPDGLGIFRQKTGGSGRVDAHAVSSSCDVL